MLVELKNGDTYNGRLVSCDTWMNITLRDVICTSRVCMCVCLSVWLGGWQAWCDYLFTHTHTYTHTYSQDGDRFWKIPECYVRGNSIKYLRVPEEVIDMVNEEDLERERTSLLSFCVCYFYIYFITHTHILTHALTPTKQTGRGGAGRGRGRLGAGRSGRGKDHACMYIYTLEEM